MISNVNTTELEVQLNSYRAVAEDPHGTSHFEAGRVLAERLGYAPAELDRIPAAAIDSFGGVGYFFDLAELADHETVVDLGSGSGMDTFIASLLVGRHGKVIGIDMADAPLAKAERLRREHGFENVFYRRAHIEETGLDEGTADCVISNGAIHLAPDKTKVFAEAARLLKRGGRLAIADVVMASVLPDTIVCSMDLWAASIGGAAQREAYRSEIEGAGLEVVTVKENTQCRFVSDRAPGPLPQVGVKSVSILARKK